MTNEMPKLLMARTGNPDHVREYLRLGWTLSSQHPEVEPAEYRLIWDREIGEPVRPSSDPSDWGHNPPTPELQS